LVHFQRFRNNNKKTHTQQQKYFETEHKVEPTSAGKDAASMFDRIAKNGDGAWVRNEGGAIGLNALLNSAVRQNEGNHEIATNLAGTQTGHLPYGS
jgi:phage major head subunit gpT-like protein